MRRWRRRGLRGRDSCLAAPRADGCLRDGRGGKAHCTAPRIAHPRAVARLAASAAWVRSTATDRTNCAEGWRSLRDEIALCAAEAAEAVAAAKATPADSAQGVADDETDEEAAWAAAEREELVARAEAAWQKRSRQEQDAMFSGYDENEAGGRGGEGGGSMADESGGEGSGARGTGGRRCELEWRTRTRSRGCLVSWSSERERLSCTRDAARTLVRRAPPSRQTLRDGFVGLWAA